MGLGSVPHVHARVWSRAWVRLLVLSGQHGPGQCATRACEGVVEGVGAVARAFRSAWAWAVCHTCMRGRGRGRGCGCSCFQVSMGLGLDNVSRQCATDSCGGVGALGQS
jgi:hypothetical protein